MLSPLFSLALASAFPLALLSLTLLLSSRSPPNRDKLSPFECGFDPKNKARLPFSLRFFLLAIIFLVFDIEIILLLPTPLTTSHPSSTWPSTLMFLIVLIAGLLHEWQEGSLEWHP